MEFTFRCFQRESGFLNSSQDCSDVPPVVLQILREDEDVVQICHTENIQVFAQNLIYPSLERFPCIGQPERHDALFV